MKGNSLLLCLILLLVSCGKGINELTSAPKSKDQVGLIASCTTRAQAQSLSQKLNIKYRVISESAKLIEFVGISKSDLLKELPNSKIRPNKLIEKPLVQQSDVQSLSYSNQAFFGNTTPEYGNSHTPYYFPHLNQINYENTQIKGDNIIIAIIDTGVSYNHPHLAPNILVNSQDQHGNSADGLDNDNNGLVDDYAGWDFYNGDAYPDDDNGHGTHVAGLAASTYMGIAPKAKILPVKVLGANGAGDLGTIAQGILYALDKGAKVINLSLGGEANGPITNELQNMINTIKIAKNRGAIVVAAAGNGGSDGLGDCNDESPVYPANTQEDNLISVAAVNSYNELTEYSNFGGSTVHLAAPGGDRYTGALQSTGTVSCFGRCSSGNIPYRTMMGTSMATPIVSGAIALLLQKYPSLSPSQIRNKIFSSVDKVESLNGIVKTSGVLNIKKALN